MNTNDLGLGISVGILAYGAASVMGFSDQARWVMGSMAAWYMVQIGVPQRRRLKPAWTRQPDERLHAEGEQWDVPATDSLLEKTYV